MVLHKKIQQLKRTAAPINYRNLSVNQYGTLVTDFETNLDKRIVKGYLLIWGSVNSYREMFIKGCCAKSINERGPGTNASYEIKFLNQHDQKDPLSLFAVLKEDETGLYFETKPLDDVASADRVIKQLRSGTLNNFSIGWNYVWDKTEYDDKQDLIILKEINLYEGSVVSIPAEMNTYCVRSMEDVEDMNEDIEEFINTLPRKDRLQARQLFARQQSLIDLEPLKTRSETLEIDKPVMDDAIDYDFLINNFKL